MKPLIIGIDNSTTGCKAIAWDREGRPVAPRRANCPLMRPEPDSYDQDAEQWGAGVAQALHRVLDSIDGRRVKAVCVTNQQESFVPVDRDGRPTRNAIRWWLNLANSKKGIGTCHER